MTFAIIEYDDAMDAHFVPPVQKWSEWRLRLARWLLRADQDAARKRLRNAIARSGQEWPLAGPDPNAKTFWWWTTPTLEDAEEFKRLNSIAESVCLLHAPTGIFHCTQPLPTGNPIRDLANASSWMPFMEEGDGQRFKPKENQP